MRREDRENKKKKLSPQAQKKKLEEGWGADGTGYWHGGGGEGMSPPKASRTLRMNLSIESCDDLALRPHETYKSGKKTSARIHIKPRGTLARNHIAGFQPNCLTIECLDIDTRDLREVGLIKPVIRQAPEPGETFTGQIYKVSLTKKARRRGPLAISIRVKEGAFSVTPMREGDKCHNAETTTFRWEYQGVLIMKMKHVTVNSGGDDRDYFVDIKCIPNLDINWDDFEKGGHDGSPKIRCDGKSNDEDIEIFRIDNQEDSPYEKDDKARIYRARFKPSLKVHSATSHFDRDLDFCVAKGDIHALNTPSLKNESEYKLKAVLSIEPTMTLETFAPSSDGANRTGTALLVEDKRYAVYIRCQPNVPILWDADSCDQDDTFVNKLGPQIKCRTIDTPDLEHGAITFERVPELESLDEQQQQRDQPPARIYKANFKDSIVPVFDREVKFWVEKGAIRAGPRFDHRNGKRSNILDGITLSSKVVLKRLSAMPGDSAYFFDFECEPNTGIDWDKFQQDGVSGISCKDSTARASIDIKRICNDNELMRKHGYNKTTDLARIFRARITDPSRVNRKIVMMVGKNVLNDSAHGHTNLDEYELDMRQLSSMKLEDITEKNGNEENKLYWADIRCSPICPGSFKWEKFEAKGKPNIRCYCKDEDLGDRIDITRQKDLEDDPDSSNSRVYRARFNDPSCFDVCVTFYADPDSVLRRDSAECTFSFEPTMELKDITKENDGIAEPAAVIAFFDILCTSNVENVDWKEFERSGISCCTGSLEEDDAGIDADLTSKLTVKQKEDRGDYIRVYRLSFGDFHGDALCWVKEGALKAGPGGYHTNPKESKPRLPLKVSFQDIISSSSDSSEEEDLGIEVHISDFSLVSFLGGEVEITGTFADKLLSGTEIVIEHAP